MVIILPDNGDFFANKLYYVLERKKERMKQTNKQTNKVTKNQINKQTNKQTFTISIIQKTRQTGKEIDGLMKKHAGCLWNRTTGRNTSSGSTIMDVKSKAKLRLK